MENSLPNPAISADIRVTLTPCSKTRALPTTAITLGTVAAPKAILAALSAPALPYQIIQENIMTYTYTG